MTYQPMHFFTTYRLLCYRVNKMIPEGMLVTFWNPRLVYSGSWMCNLLESGRIGRLPWTLAEKDGSKVGLFFTTKNWLKLISFSLLDGHLKQRFLKFWNIEFFEGRVFHKYFDPNIQKMKRNPTFKW